MRGEDDDAFRARMEAKGERNRYFRGLWSVAEEAARKTPQVTVKPKKVPRERVERAAPVPEPCAGGCGRTTRPHGTTLEQHPNTVRRGQGKRCDACSNGRRPRAGMTPTNCVECGVAMTTARSPQPGAARHIAKGLCHGCYKAPSQVARDAGRTPRTPHGAVSTCQDCGEKALHVRKLPPGSAMRRYVGSGRCSACYARWQRQRSAA